MGDCAGKLTQRQWFEVGEDYYHGLTLRECEAKHGISVHCIAKCLTEITGVELRPSKGFVKAEKSSEPEYEQETLTHHEGEHASGRAPRDPPEDAPENPRKIIGV